MEPRGCGDFFIATIKNGSVTKLCNVDSCGNPALKYKSLKDVYECEDAKRVSSKSAVGRNKVKTKASCLPEVDRTSYKQDFGSSDILNDVNDLSYDSNMTLGQLKKYSRRKKRKFSCGRHLNDANEVYDNLQIGEDDLDLKEPLINWKMKLSKEMPKVKRKRSSGGAIKSELALSVKLEPVHGFETDMFANRDLSLVCVKREDPESDSFEIASPISFDDVVEPNFDMKIPDQVPEGHAYKNQLVDIYIEDNHDCVLNEVCYDHLDPIPLVEVSAGDIGHVSDEMEGFSPCDVSPTAESDTDDKSDYMLSASLNVQICQVSGILNDSRVMETSEQSCSSSRVQLVNTAVNNEIVLTDSPPFVTQTESFPLRQSASFLDSRACSSPEDESVCTNDGITEMDQSRASLDSHACSSPEDESVSTNDGITEMDQSQASSLDCHACSSPQDESVCTNNGITEMDQSQASLDSHACSSPEDGSVSTNDGLTEMDQSRASLNCHACSTPQDESVCTNDGITEMDQSQASLDSHACSIREDESVFTNDRITEIGQSQASLDGHACSSPEDEESVCTKDGITETDGSRASLDCHACSSPVEESVCANHGVTEMDRSQASLDCHPCSSPEDESVSTNDGITEMDQTQASLDSHACSSPEDESVCTNDGITEMDQSQASLDSHACSSPEDESVSTNDGITEMDHSQACSSTDTSQKSWSPRNRIPSDLTATNEKQPPEMVSKDSKCLSSSRTAISLDDDTLSAPVVQNSGRLTRKIISPTSQERLSLSLNCVELHNDADEYKCKEKLFFPEENQSNPSIARSNIETARRDENIEQPRQLNQKKVFIKRTQIRHKAKNGKRGFPPKNTLEQPCYPRSFPCINTGCTSVKNCSKGAIAFSQQQMHSIDSLAGNLLNELKSMKEIVEQKLLLNSSRNLTLRNNADEVVSAIKTATRAEENAKRLLSVMARDSNRFCTIMSLTQDGPSTSENEIPRKRRKIVFADEAGEKLCHVKFFENGSPSVGSPVQKLHSQNENALN